MTTNRLQDKESVSLQGYLLVAVPNCQDPAVAGSVCMVVHHNPQGAIGVFLNKQLDTYAPVLWKQLVGKPEGYSKNLLHLGGPDSGPVIAVHNQEQLAEFTSARGVYFAARVDNLRQLLNLASSSQAAQHSAVKIIVGQANWGAGQLDREFAAGKWLPLPVSSKVVFADKSDMWRQAMREIGNQFVVRLCGCKVIPPTELVN